MKTTKKFLSIILAILMVISIIPLTASAETPTSGVCGKNATWEFDETTSTLTISGEGVMYDFYYHFYSSKETVDTRPWASYDDLIEFVVIDDGITHIGEYAFLDFDLLTIITIPDSVTSIGEYAFEEAEPLVVHYKGTETQWNNVTIGGANTGLYYERTRFYFVDFPVSDSGTWHENITWSFDADTSTLTISGTGIMNADFGEGGYHLNRKQFRGHRGWDYYKYHIERVVITDGVTQIGGDVFRYHPNLKDVIIPNSIHTIDIGALDSGESLSDIYYSGTEEDWNNINIRECSLLGKPNSSYKPNNATIHFLGEEVHECSYNAVVTAPTCKEQGYTTYTCECGDSYVDDYVGALGHTPANAVEENYIAPTCTENGSKDIVVYCSVCKDEISRDTAIIDATGHADNDGDGYCDTDNELLDPSVECDKNCHKIGISGFIWKIINFFNKLFGLNKNCDCGVAHY